MLGVNVVVRVQGARTPAPTSLPKRLAGWHQCPMLAPSTTLARHDHKLPWHKVYDAGNHVPRRDMRRTSRGSNFSLLWLLRKSAGAEKRPICTMTFSSASATHSACRRPPSRSAECLVSGLLAHTSTGVASSSATMPLAVRKRLASPGPAAEVRPSPSFAHGGRGRAFACTQDAIHVQQPRGHRPVCYGMRCGCWRDLHRQFCPGRVHC